MAKKKKIIIYSKWCLECDYSEEFTDIKMLTQREGIEMSVVRTAYRPLRHHKAVKIWASANGIEEKNAQDYPPFIVKGRSVTTFMDYAKQCKNKLARSGKKKGMKECVETAENQKE